MRLLTSSAVAAPGKPTDAHAATASAGVKPRLHTVPHAESGVGSTCSSPALAREPPTRRTFSVWCTAALEFDDSLKIARSCSRMRAGVIVRKKSRSARETSLPVASSVNTKLMSVKPAVPLLALPVIMIRFGATYSQSASAAPKFAPGAATVAVNWMTGAGARPSPLQSTATASHAAHSDADPTPASVYEQLSRYASCGAQMTSETNAV